MRKKFKIQVFLMIFAIFCLNSCLKRVEKRGFSFDLTDYEAIEEGVTGRDEVRRIMGSPSFVAGLDGEIWLYFAQDIEKFLFFKPKVVERRIFLLGFDDFGVVSRLENYDLDDEKKVKFARAKTEVKSTKQGFFKSIFSNVGQVSPQ